MCNSWIFQRQYSNCLEKSQIFKYADLILNMWTLFFPLVNCSYWSFLIFIIEALKVILYVNMNACDSVGSVLCVLYQTKATSTLNKEQWNIHSFYWKWQTYLLVFKCCFQRLAFDIYECKYCWFRLRSQWYFYLELWIALVGVSGPRTGSLGSPHLARSIRPARPQSNAFTTTTNLKLL